MRKLSIRAPFVISALLASAWSPVTAAPSGDAVVIRAGEVIVRPGEVMKDVDVLVIDGVIRRVAAEIEAPEGARELSGAVVCAGFLDPWSVLGINATDVSFTSVTPSTRTADAIDPFGQEFQKKQALEAGVTAVRVQASHRALVSGLSSVMSLAPNGDEGLIASDETALGASIGLTDPSSGGSSFAMGADGSFTLVESGPTPMDPFERISQVDKIVGQLEAGVAYRVSQNAYAVDLKEWEEAIAEKVKELEKDFKKAKKDRDKEIEEAKEKGKEFKEERYKEDKAPKAPKYDADKEVFARVANGELPLVVEVHRTAELRNLLEATAKFNRLRMVIAGGTEAAPFAKQLAARNISVIVNPSPMGEGAFDEFDGHDVSLAATLAEEEVTVLIGSGGRSAGASRDLSLLAALAIGGGLEREHALTAITSGPAKVFGLTSHGAVEFGKQADLLILDGQPLSTTTSVQAVLVDGRVVVEPKE